MSGGMKKLTELDLQNALDECTAKRFRAHGDWLTGMTRRLNAVLAGTTNKKVPTHRNLIIKTGNNTEPEVPCIS